MGFTQEVPVARSDLLVHLIKSGSQGDVAGFRRSAEHLIAEERAKKHHLLADRLSESLRAGIRMPPRNGRVQSRDQGLDYLFEQEPKRGFGDLVLTPETEQICRELVEEQHRAELLHAHGLEPRHRMLLSGPPGNGKTSLAEAVATELMVPLLTIRYDTLIGSFLGETAGRLQKVFDYAATQRCVLFFDEFDTVGKERGDQKEMGEVKRVVSSLLMQMDRLPSHVVVITASNHSELLDRAVWRRFQVRIHLPLPTQAQTAAYIERYFEKKNIRLGYAAKTIASKINTHSFAEVSEFCSDIWRRAILEKQQNNAKKLVSLKIKQWQSRREIGPPQGSDPNEAT